MRVFIVYCHPSKDSFTKNMCEAFIKGFSIATKILAEAMR